MVSTLDSPHERLITAHSRSGHLKELLFSSDDGCFYVTVNGEEKFRSDVRETVYGYYQQTLLD